MMSSAPRERDLQRLATMRLCRAYEHAAVELQRQGSPGTCTSVGQEACAVGVMEALEARDRILTNHRSASHLLARGADPKRMLAEVLGRADGYCGGFSGSLHISVAELGVILTSTIVGGELSMATGVALSQTMGQGEEGAVTAVFFGDGAACEGIFHEALNLAVVWRLPLLFVCENNQWQAYVHRLETMPDTAISDWATGHGLPVAVVDGNDVEAISQAASAAVGRIRDGQGPQFLELSTYRLRGHYEPDDQAYVSAEELAGARERDPIVVLERKLVAAGVAAETLAEIDSEAQERINQAVAFAQASAWPDSGTLTRNVYASEEQSA